VRTRLGDASARLFDILLQEDDAAAILDSLTRIAGETLGVDRSMIYDVSFTHDHAEGLTEWLDPSGVATATKATYPLALFRSAAELLRDEHAPIESHRHAPHPALVADRSDTLLHDTMQVASLLWFPFAYRADGYYLLAFNHVRAPHRWEPSELEFMATLTRHVSMALVKIELIRKRRAVEEALFQAQKLESLGVLAGGVAHDFNNLMVGVISNAELLIRRLLSEPELRGIAQAILHAGQRASALADQLLAYSGRGEPGPSRVALAEVVASTLALVEAAASDVRIELVVDGEPGVVDCNRAQLEQVVLNLAVNAAEATRARGGTVRVQIMGVELDARDAAAFPLPAPPSPGAYVVLEVQDPGEGMDAATIQRIFDPFFSTKRAGRGLGLSAVLGIVKHHQGALAVQSTPGQGSTFRVAWPVAAGAGPAGEPRAPARSPSPTGHLVMCIDDDPIVLDAVRAVLEDGGYRGVTARNGADGLALLDTHGREIACVLLDLTMPPPSGLEVLAALRGLRPELPVLLMSGYTEAALAPLLGERTRFLRKPFAGDGLLEAIATLIAAEARVSAS
jgi:signal transduction histidine kinase/CheY-like chemotaxis protein